jgi:hypothetical protein
MQHVDASEYLSMTGSDGSALERTQIMRFESWHILADEDIGKVIVVILVLIVWGIGSLASMVKKANEEARRRAMAKPTTPVAPIAASDQRMVVGGFAATPVPRPPPISPAMMQRAKALAQKGKPLQKAQRIVPPPIVARVATPKLQLWKRWYPARPQASRGLNWAARKRPQSESGWCRGRCGSNLS